MGRDQRKRITDFVITMVSMALVSLHFSIGLVGLLWPIRRMNKSTFTMLGPVLLLISIKILLMLVFPLGQYAKYEFNLSSMLREILTLTMFYAWFIVGYKIYNYRFFTSLGKAALTAALIFVHSSSYSRSAFQSCTISPPTKQFFSLSFLLCSLTKDTTIILYYLRSPFSCLRPHIL